MINHRVEPGHHLEAPVPFPEDTPTRPGIQRRDAIRMAAAAGLVGLLAAGCSPAFSGVSAIGQAWLRTHPEEGTASALLALLPAGIDPAALPGANLRLAQGAITADFVADRVDWADGWLLSATEARIAALFTLR